MSASAVLVLLLGVTGCGGAIGTQAALPACGKPPSPAPDRPPPGAVLPETARMTALREDAGLTQLNAYVELSPADVVAWIEAQGGAEILESSPPGREMELLVDDGVYNTWMSVRAICDGASVVAEVIAAAADAGELPPVRGAQP